MPHLVFLIILFPLIGVVVNTLFARRWNETAIGLYERLGAKVLNDWRICRLEGEELREAARQCPIS